MVVQLVLVKVFFLLIAVLVGLSVTIIRIDHLVGFVVFVGFVGFVGLVVTSRTVIFSVLVPTRVVIAVFFGDLVVDIVVDLTVDFDADLLVDFVTGLVGFVTGLVGFVVGGLMVVCSSVVVDRGCVYLYIVLSKMQLVKMSWFRLFLRFGFCSELIGKQQHTDRFHEFAWFLTKH